MENRRSLLDPDPDMEKGLELGTQLIGELLEGPDFEGKKVLQLLAQGLTLSEIHGISETQLDVLFQKAAQLLEAGEIENSRQLFLTIVRLQPLEERYTYGLATTYQVEGDFRTAGRLYAFYLNMNADCVHGRLRLAECLLAESEFEPAIDLFSSVAEEEDLAGSLPELRTYAADMVRRCESMRKGAAH